MNEWMKEWMPHNTILHHTTLYSPPLPLAPHTPSHHTHSHNLTPCYRRFYGYRVYRSLSQSGILIFKSWTETRPPWKNFSVFYRRVRHNFFLSFSLSLYLKNFLFSFFFISIFISSHIFHSHTNFFILNMLILSVSYIKY